MCCSIEPHYRHTLHSICMWIELDVIDEGDLLIIEWKNRVERGGRDIEVGIYIIYKRAVWEIKKSTLDLIKWYDYKKLRIEIDYRSNVQTLMYMTFHLSGSLQIQKPILVDFSLLFFFFLDKVLCQLPERLDDDNFMIISFMSYDKHGKKQPQ